ncbi:hypothetical protein IWW34DRAFT_839857 [Fusarium oxysporum f. sp. albedinis]|nr:hypothetical protein IWW34DRAFT_839857 [Fusarium oxysporum f. sp. albedinis]KAJ0154262.1 Oxidoreductase BOA1 [Fusarium oxysporum f. sp. albedinis]
MSGFSQGHQRTLLPATELPPAPKPRVVLPHYPRVGVTIACETCRKRKIRCNGNRPRCKGCIRAGSECNYVPMNKDHELRQRYEHLQIEKTDYQKLIYLLRSRDHKEAHVILDMLRQNTSVHEVLSQVEHGDMLCELSLVSGERYSILFFIPSPRGFSYHAQRALVTDRELRVCNSSSRSRAIESPRSLQSESD